MNNKELQSILGESMKKVLNGELKPEAGSAIASLGNVMLKSALAEATFTKQSVNDGGFFALPKTPPLEALGYVPPEEEKAEQERPEFYGDYEDTPVVLIYENGMETKGRATSLVNGNIRFIAWDTKRTVLKQGTTNWKIVKLSSEEIEANGN